MSEVLNSWAFVVPAVGAVVAWITNEWRKREYELHLRKEEYYKFLLMNLSSFMVDGDVSIRAEMLVQLQLCWIYCPDHVIRKSNDFLETFKVGSQSTQEEKNIAMQDFVIAIRKDMLPWYKKNTLGRSDVIARSVPKPDTE